MKTVWRLTLAMIIAMALTACQTKPTVDTDTTPPPETDITPKVETRGATDPYDYEDPINLEPGSGSLLAERVIYFDYDKSTVSPRLYSRVPRSSAWPSSVTRALELDAMYVACAETIARYSGRTVDLS